MADEGRVVTAKLPDDLVSQLDQIADRIDRSKSWIVREAVTEWLVEQGEIPAERVFVVAPKLTGDGIEDKGAATRVDFSIK